MAVTAGANNRLNVTGTLVPDSLELSGYKISVE